MGRENAKEERHGIVVVKEGEERGRGEPCDWGENKVGVDGHQYEWRRGHHFATENMQ